MHVRMNETRLAAPDGIRVVELEAGQVYDLPDEMAERYLERSLARPADEEPAPQAPPAVEKDEKPKRRRRRIARPKQ